MSIAAEQINDVPRAPTAPGLRPGGDEAAWTAAEAAATTPQGAGTLLAAAPRSEWWDVADIVGDAANRALDNLPPGLEEVAKTLKETPPDVQVVGSVVNTPVGKAGVFLLQPTLPANPFLPDLSKKPIVFVSLPSQNVVATWNPNNNQVEFGPGATTSLGPDTLGFYNMRVGGRGATTGSGPHDVASVSGNFGVLNSTLSDPVADAVIDATSKGAARGLTTIAAALDIATIPSGEGVAAAVAIEAARAAISSGIRANTTTFVGLGWRGADFERHANGETTLNLSGAEFRLQEGEGPGGSGRPSSDFIWDAAR